jgi:hypothetical protein
MRWRRIGAPRSGPRGSTRSVPGRAPPGRSGSRRAGGGAVGDRSAARVSARRSRPARSGHAAGPRDDRARRFGRADRPRDASPSAARDLPLGTPALATSAGAVGAPQIHVPTPGGGVSPIARQGADRARITRRSRADHAPIALAAGLG